MGARDEFNLQEAFELARLTIRSLMLINGGGAIAVLAFFGNLTAARHSPIINGRLIFWGMTAFVIGLVLATAAAIVGYFIQLRWGAQLVKAIGDVGAFQKRTIVINQWAVVFAICSLCAFVVGVVLAARAILPVVS